jgi:predicted transposase/invertase (TIGR01784 family)
MDKNHPPPITATTPHNNFFEFGLSHPDTARSLIRQMLPSNVVSQLNLATLKRQPKSFVDRELRESHSDVIYSVMTIPDTDGNSTEVLIYFLMEHKSEQEPLTAFQLLRYMVRVWEACLRDGEPLTPIIPLVVYHGESEWRKNRTLSDIIPYPDELSQYAVQFQFPILDLWQTDLEKLPTPEDSFLHCLFYLLKYSRSSQLNNVLEKAFQLIAPTEDLTLSNDRIIAACIYIMSTNPTINPETVKLAIEQTFSTYIYPDSILGKERQAGVAEGLEKGIEKGVEKGILIAKIQMQEERCGLPVSPLEQFTTWSIAELKAKLSELEASHRNRE